MAVREGPALGVLASEPHRDPLDDESAERERLRVTPVDTAFVERVVAALELARELRMDGEPLGHAEQLSAELAEPVGGHARVDRARSVARHSLLVGRRRDLAAER